MHTNTHTQLRKHTHTQTCTHKHACTNMHAQIVMNKNIRINRKACKQNPDNRTPVADECKACSRMAASLLHFSSTKNYTHSPCKHENTKHHYLQTATFLTTVSSNSRCQQHFQIPATCPDCSTDSVMCMTEIALTMPSPTPLEVDDFKYLDKASHE